MDSQLSRGISYGVSGGFIGAIIMGALASMMPVPPANVPFFVAAVMMMGVTGSMAVVGGWAMHLITGLIIGAIFGTIVAKVDKLRASNVGRGLGLGVAAGIIVWIAFFVPLMSMMASSLRMSLMSMPPLLIGGSFIAHVIFGLVMGGIAGALLQKELSRRVAYSCPAWGTSFPSQSALMEHKNKSHAQKGSQQQQFRCTACGASFNSQSELMNHAKSAHPMPAR